MPKARVLTFGSFDVLHQGHRYFLAQARQLGDHLTVVVSPDSYIRSHKKREPSLPELARVAAIEGLHVADIVRVGEEIPGYGLLKDLPFDILAVGYDQPPSDEEIRRLLNAAGKQGARLVRLSAYRPEVYKSSLLRKP